MIHLAGIANNLEIFKQIYYFLNTRHRKAGRYLDGGAPLL
jgi:hypothetical protein